MTDGASTRDSSHIPPRLGGYEILERLGEGGAGAVYKARDTRLDRIVAIKVVSAARMSDPVRRARFLREARAASAINHPNIVTIYGIDSEGDLDFLVMEFVDGRTLEALLTAGPLPADVAVRYAADVAEALGSAHQHGIVHRDLKPSNIMITADGLVKVLDFSLARHDSPETPSDPDARTRTASLTIEGAICGTQYYMSPEQALGMAGDRRSDVFSLGIVLYQMLSGRRPFAGPTLRDFIQNLELKSVPPLGDVRPDLPEHVLAAVSTALQKDPDARFQTMAEFRDTLLGMSGGKAAGAWRRTLLRYRRAIIAAVVVLATVAGLAWLLPDLNPNLAGNLFATRYQRLQQAQAQLLRYDQPGNLDHAISGFSSLVQSDRDYAPAWAGLADAYAQRFENDRDPHWLRLADDASEQAVKLDDQLAAAHVCRGRALWLRNNHTEAIREIERARMLDPANWIACIRLGRIYQSQGDRGRAEQAFQRALEIRKDHWLAPGAYGVFLYASGRFREAADQFAAASRLAPDNALIYNNLAGAYHQMDRHEEAAATIQRAIEIAPTAAAYSNLGTWLYYQGKFHDAAAALERAVAMGPNVYTRWGNLADVYRLLPESQQKAAQAYDRAIQLGRKAAEANSGDAAPVATLALYLARTGRKTEAAEELEKIVNMPSPGPAVAYRVAVLYELLGNRTRALAWLESAVTAGYSRREIEAEPDLVGLRGDARYGRIAATAR